MRLPWEVLCAGYPHTRLPLCGQCPAVCDGAVLAIFLPHHRIARAPAGPGSLQGVPVAAFGLRNGAELGFCPGKLIAVCIAHVSIRELVSLLLLFGFEKDPSELFCFSVLKSGYGVSLCKPSMEVWSCEPGDKLMPPSGTGFTELCVYKGGCASSLRILHGINDLAGPELSSI